MLFTHSLGSTLVRAYLLSPSPSCLNSPSSSPFFGTLTRYRQSVYARQNPFYYCRVITMSPTEPYHGHGDIRTHALTLAFPTTVKSPDNLALASLAPPLLLPFQIFPPYDAELKFSIPFHVCDLSFPLAARSAPAIKANRFSLNLTPPILYPYLLEHSIAMNQVEAPG